MKRDTPLGEHLPTLRRALRRLRAEQTDGRRRTARAKVKQALAAFEKALDAEFPAPARKAPTARRARGKGSASHVEVTRNEIMKYSTYAATYGVRLKTREAGINPLNGSKASRYFVPHWFKVAIDSNASKKTIGEAKKSITARRALLGAASLLNAASTLHP